MAGKRRTPRSIAIDYYCKQFRKLEKKAIKEGNPVDAFVLKKVVRGCVDWREREKGRNIRKTTS